MIRSHVRSAAIAFTTALALGLTSDAATAAPAGLAEDAVDIDLKGASIVNVFRLLADIGKRDVVLDACVHGTVDLRLQNTPLPMVFDALSSQLGLVYEEEDGRIKVNCRGDGGARTTGTRVSLAEQGTSLPDVLDRLAASAKLEGVDYRAHAKPKVSVTLESVRLSTAVEVLAETSRLDITIAKRRIVVGE